MGGPCELKVFFSCHGLLKLGTLGLGLFAVGLTADSYMHHIGHAMETFYLAIVIIMLIASAIFHLLFICTIIQDDSDMTKKIDLLFHLVAGLFLILSSAFWFVSVDKHYVMFRDEEDEKKTTLYVPSDPYNFIKRFPNKTYVHGSEEHIKESKLHHTERVFAGIFGLFNGFVYLAIAGLTWVRIKN